MNRILLVLSFLTLCTETQGFIASRHKWKTIKTPHFNISVTEPYLELGREVAKKAELAHLVLQKFSTKAPRKTYIILDPTKHFSNGTATFFPYPTIILQTAAPSTQTSIANYDDWLYELLIHEYTHILSFHNTRNYARLLRWPLGTSISPGYFLPVWFLEGLGVYNETIFSKGGRLRDSRYLALQKEFSEGKRVPLANINEQDLRKYPFGQNPYFFGSWLQQAMLENSPDKQASELHKKFSGRVPYFIPSGYKSVTGKSLQKTWRKLFKGKKNTTPSGKMERLAKKVKGHRYFLRSDVYLNDQLVQQNLTTNKEKILFSRPQIIDYKVDNQDVYFLAQAIRKREHIVTELNHFDQKSKKIKVLTKKFNARVFDLMGKQIVFSKIFPSHDELHLTSVEKPNESKMLVKTPLGGRLGQVSFVDRDTIAYTEKISGQKEELKTYVIEGGLTKTLLTENHITFVTSQNKKLYALSENLGKKKIHFPVGTDSFSIKPNLEFFDVTGSNNILGTMLTAKGPRIVDTSPQKLASSYSPKVLSVYDSLPPVPKFDLKEKNYSSFTNILPHYIIPNATLSPYGFSGEFLYGLSTGGSDPLGLNQYSLSIFTDTVSQEVSGTASYTSSHLETPISLVAGLFFEPLSETLTRESSFGTLAISRSFRPSVQKSHDFQLSFQWDETTLVDSTQRRGGTSLAWTYRNLRASSAASRELAPAGGQLFSLRGSYFHDINDDYIHYSQITGGFRLYSKVPFLKTHRIVLAFDGSWSDDFLTTLYAPNSRNAFLRNSAPGAFLFRGLPTGALFANEGHALGHLEYRFPLFRTDFGIGTLPAFLKRVTAAFTSDFGAISGSNFIPATPELIDFDTFLSSAGAEIQIEAKIGYHVPINFQIGFYQFLDDEIFDGDPEIFVGMQIVGLPL